MPTRYFLGVDVGGTKTHAMLAGEDCRVLGFGEAGPGNHEGVGYPGLEAAMAEAVGQALRQAGLTIHQVSGAGFGVGGYDWPSEREPTLRSIHTLGLAAPLELVNDALLGLIAGARQGWGIAVVGGTGCNCWGWDASHRTAHVTGAGGQMGEAAGAGDLVQEAVARISRFWSHRGPPTRLVEAFVDYTGAKDLDDLIEGLVMQRYALDTRAAPLIFQVAAAGDPVACQVITWAGESLADLANGVIRQLHLADQPFEVILVGSLYNGGELLIGPMRQAILRLAPRAQLVKLEAPPVVGGVLLGMQQAGLETADRRKPLIAAARGL
jgi:N-acetylglucosamine kinase-like BadF-type ATPase